MIEIFFKQCDLISPEITLFFKGGKNHSSIFSGIITIIAYSLVLIFIIHNIKYFINKENPTIYYYNRYVEDAGSFPLNSSGIFHYFQLINTNRESDITIDYDAIRIIGIDRSIEYYMRINADLTKTNHWVYGTCNYNEINNDKISKLISGKIFSQSACIKEYYDLQTQKYSKIGESGFRWPVLDHGASNPNKTLYGIVIEKCHNDSLTKTCKPVKQINEFFNRFAINLNIIDEYADVLNYKNPYTKYIYALTNGLNIGTISLNNVNFNPSITKTHTGLFLNQIDEIKSYAYSQNEKITMDPGETDIVVAFFFWMQNIMTYNERSYKKLVNLLSDIGGFKSFVLLLAFFINSLVKNFIILLDTEELFLINDKVNYNTDKNDKLIKNPIINRKASEILYPPKLKSNNNKSNQNQNSQFKESYDNINNISSEPMKNLCLKNANNNNNYYNKCIKIDGNEKKGSKDINLYREKLKVNQSNEILMNNCFDSKVQKTKKSDNNTISLKKNNFTLINYIYYLITFKRGNPKIKFFEDFRTKIISEENLLQNYSDIYKLLKKLV